MHKTVCLTTLTVPQGILRDLLEPPYGLNYGSIHIKTWKFFATCPQSPKQNLWIAFKSQF